MRSEQRSFCAASHKSSPGWRPSTTLRLRMNKNRTWVVRHAKNAPFGLSPQNHQKHDFLCFVFLHLLVLVVSFNSVNKSCYLLVASKSSSCAKVATFSSWYGMSEKGVEGGLRFRKTKIPAEINFARSLVWVKQ